MKKRMLMAEMRVDIEKIRNIESLEINIGLLYPQETRKYHQSAEPVTFHPGRQLLTPERKAGHQMDNKFKTRSNNSHNMASVKVKSVSVNVITRV